MSDRIKRRKAKRENKPQTITHRELAAMATRNPELDSFVAMLNEDVYKMHMIVAAVASGTIDKDTALSTADVYDIPMVAGFKDEDDLLVADFAAEVFSRFKLSTKLGKDNSLFEALLVDGDDDFFKFLLNADPADKENKEEYEMVYYSAVKNVMRSVTNGVIDKLITS